VSLRHVVAKSSGGGPGDKRAHARAFPGTISARKVFFGEVPACASPETAEEGGANTGPEEAAESRESAGPGTALKGGYAPEIAANRFAREEECAVEPSAAAEGDARAGVGASTAEWVCTLLVPGPSAFSIRN